MTYRCKHFAIHELVPRVVYLERGEKAWELLDDRLLITLDRLRKRYGIMYLNNYFWGGAKQWQGLRTPDSVDFKQYSDHTYGRASDPSFANVTAEQVRQDILDNPDDECFEFITSLEFGVSWLHFAVSNYQRIRAFYP